MGARGSGGHPSLAAQNGGAPEDLGGMEWAPLVSKGLEVVGLPYLGPGALQAPGLSSPDPAEQSWAP